MEPVLVEVSGTIKHDTTNPITIEVTRGQKGSYGWTIKISGTDILAIGNQLCETNAKLKADFPQPEGG